MEVFGAAASAIALAQTAISLAQALNTYAGAISDSVDDVVVIADDISDTYGHLQQLGTVLKKNEETKLLNEAAVSSAGRCVSKSQTLLNRLRKLFEKSGATSDPGRVDSGNIDISRFRRGIWIIYKSEFELRRAELHHIKADISLIYLTYLTMASGSEGAEKQRAIDQMKLVYAKRTVLDKDLKKLRARKRSDQKVSREADDEGSPVHRPYRGTRGQHDYHSDDDEEEPAVVFAKLEDLHSEFDLWRAREKEKEETVTREREVLQKQAVEAFKRQKEEIALKWQADTQKLRDTLTQHGLPPQRIDRIVRDAYPTNEPLPQSDAGTLTNGSKGQPSVSVDRPRPPSTTSSWFRRRSKRSDYETASYASTSVPDVLRDASAPGGVAQLKALYFQKVTVAPARQAILKLEVAVPDFRLIPNFLSPESSRSQQNNISEFLQGFANVPEDYRYHIVNEVRLLQNDPDFDWMILQIEPVKSKENSRKFMKKRAGEVVGVYVVLRKLTRSDDIFTDRQQSNRGNLLRGSVPATQEELDASYDTAVQDVPIPVIIRPPLSKGRDGALNGGMRGRNYMSHYKRRSEDGSPDEIIIKNHLSGRRSPQRSRIKVWRSGRSRLSPPRRRARFSESSERISSLNRRRPTVYYSSDDSSVYVPVPVNSHTRRRTKIYESSSPSRSPSRSRWRRSSVNVMEPEIAEKLARLRLLEEKQKSKGIDRPAPVTRRETIETMASDGYREERPWARHDDEVARAHAALKEREAFRKAEEIKMHEMAREEAIREAEERKMHEMAKLTKQGDAEVMPTRERQSHYSHGSPITRDRYNTIEIETSLPTSSRPRRAWTGLSAKGQHYREGPLHYSEARRRVIASSDDSSDNSAYDRRVRGSGRVGRRGVSAEDAVQDLLAEWTNPAVTSNKDGHKTEESVTWDDEEIEVSKASNDQKAPEQSGDLDDKPAHNAPTVESHESDSEKKPANEKDESLPNSDAQH